jgi:hypothetical protein
MRAPEYRSGARLLRTRCRRPPGLQQDPLSVVTAVSPTVMQLLTPPLNYSGTLLPPRHVSPGLNVFGVAPKTFAITPRRGKLAPAAFFRV